jgi:hypothetical protein
MPTLPVVTKAGPSAFLLLAFALIFATEAPAQSLDATQRAEVVERLAEVLEEVYVFPDMGERTAERLRGDLADGVFDDLASTDSLARKLTHIMQEVTDDKHLRARPGQVAPPAMMEIDEDEEAAMIERMRLQASRENFGFEQLLRLPGNVGLLDLRSFHNPELAATTAHAAMTYLSSSDALIVDLRQNGGGSPGMVRLLCSYLFDEPTHLNSLYWRKGEVTEEFWTLDELPGPRMADVPVFVLTSAYTFSGAEEYAYNLKTRERATIVGETTGGGAHPGGSHDIAHGITAFISEGRAINPITGTNWEGTGVAPDVACPSDEALDRALELAQRAALDRQDDLDRATRG